VAWLEGPRVIAFRHERLERGHAERLTPLLDELAREAGRSPASRIVVDVGPGSFTGTRIGVAAARALGLAWRAPVVGVESDRLVALAAAVARPDWACVLVSLEAGRGRLLLRRWRRGQPESLAPVVAEPAAAAALVLGAQGAAGMGLGPVDAPGLPQLALDPDARAVGLLPTCWPGLAPSPLYAGGAFGDAGPP